MSLVLPGAVPIRANLNTPLPGGHWSRFHHKFRAEELLTARRSLCTFQGLLRWCRRAGLDPSKGMHGAFDSFSANASGHGLLVRMSMLPQELIDRIAVAAELQHDLHSVLI